MELVVLSPRAFVVAGPADASPPAPDGVTPATRPLLGLVPVPAGSALLTPAALAPVLVTLVVLVPVSVVSVFGVPVSEARDAGALLMPGLSLVTSSLGFMMFHLSFRCEKHRRSWSNHHHEFKINSPALQDAVRSNTINQPLRLPAVPIQPGS